MSEIRIAAETRTEFGKGAARRIRRSNRVPAVIYGHGGAPRHISLPSKELLKALKTANVLLSLDVDGDAVLAIPKDVQRDPVRDLIEHVDLLAVRRGEMVNVDLSITVTGDVAPGGALAMNEQTLAVEGDATRLPGSIEIDVSGLAIGAVFLASDVVLPEGVSLVGDPEQVLAHVTGEQTAEQADAELAAAEEEAGIVHEAPASDETPTQGDASASEGNA